MSLTIEGLIVGAIVLICEAAGVEIGTEAVTGFILTGGKLLSAFMIWFGRFRKGDITFWGGRR